MRHRDNLLTEIRFLSSAKFSVFSDPILAEDKYSV
jgi:hypothetical protein